LAELVDGEPMIRALAQRALELYGYEVLEAKDGEATLEVMRSETGRRVDLASSMW
jgi:DNA-binding response OmpR family regulator